MRYASATKVSVDRSKAEIERTLERYGASQFVYGWDQENGLVGFNMRERQIKIIVGLPKRSEFTESPVGRERSERQIEEEYKKALRQRWRALALVIKAKLEAVESGIASFEKEFLAYMVLPGGRTVASEIIPKIEEAYGTGKLPPLLPAPKGKK